MGEGELILYRSYAISRENRGDQRFLNLDSWLKRRIIVPNPSFSVSPMIHSLPSPYPSQIRKLLVSFRKSIRLSCIFLKTGKKLKGMGWVVIFGVVKTHEEVTHPKPGDILEALDELEAEIQQGMKELKGMLQ